jgi:RNA-directed DNA polymerase
LEQHLGRNFGYIRYADDFIVTARSKEELDKLKPEIEKWLEHRGLTLNVEKTRIASIKDGFNFLSFHIRHFNGKCLTKPQKEKVLDKLREIKDWLKCHPSDTPEVVIRHLNPILTGWANYYRHGVSKQIFAYVDDQIWKTIWKWCLRRHRNKHKSKTWVANKYFTIDEKGRRWRFFAKFSARHGNPKRWYIARISDIPIQRHVKVKGTASSDDPMLRVYWEKRKSKAKKESCSPLEKLDLMSCWELEPCDATSVKHGS